MDNMIANEFELIPYDKEGGIAALSESLLADARTQQTGISVMSVPIAELASLGAGVASLVPALRTVTQQFETNVPGGIFRLLNDGGKGLKRAKDGSFWGATAESKMGRFEAVNSVTSTVKTALPIDPAVMMMAVALAAVEKKLDDIAEMQKQIISFLETEKESEIEADVETLVSVITAYKFNWDNEQYLSSNHKLILDIQRTARKNMIAYRKKVDDILASNQLIVAQSSVKSALGDLLKKFKYYRLSLYSYAMASLLEIMLGKNFKEEYVIEMKAEVEKQSFAYREAYDKCSGYLERMTTASIETNVMKGIGSVSKALGGAIGSIAFLKDGPVDEFLIDSGESLKKSAGSIESDTVAQFAAVKSPNTNAFTEKMEDIIQIYNHTQAICFDASRIYLVAGEEHVTG